MKVGNGADARNMMALPKAGSVNRTPNFGKLPEQRQSSGIDQNSPMPNYSEEEYIIRDHQNHK